MSNRDEVCQSESRVGENSADQTLDRGRAATGSAGQRGDDGAGGAHAAPQHESVIFVDGQTLT